MDTDNNHGSEGVDALRTLAEAGDPLTAFEELALRWPGRGWDIEALRLKTLRATIAGRQAGSAWLAPQRREPVVKHQREFKDVHEKAEFYQKLFSEAKES